jgi:hypothetical protein
MASDRERVRWGRILTIMIVGLAFTGAPFYLANEVNVGFGNDRELTSSTLTNIGTTILLIGIVFLLERSLLQRVSETAARTTARVVDERTTDLADANRALATELADLRAQFESATAADRAQRTAPLRNVSTDVSFDSIAEALETANSFGALEWGSVKVPFEAQSDSPELVSFDWRYHEVRLPDGRRDENYVAPQIEVRYEPRRNPGGGPRHPGGRGHVAAERVTARPADEAQGRDDQTRFRRGVQARHARPAREPGRRTRGGRGRSRRGRRRLD